MKDLRNFSKKRVVKDVDMGVTEGNVINDVPTADIPLHDTNNVEGEYVPTKTSILEEKVNVEEEQDTIDLYYEFLKEKGITDTIIKNTQVQLLENRTILFETTILNKIKIGFSPRPTWANDKIIEETAQHGDNFSLAMYNNVVAKTNMICSLEYIDGYNLPPISLDNYDARKNIIGSFPSFIYEKIIEELIVFDRLIAVATSDKYLETFI